MTQILAVCLTVLLSMASFGMTTYTDTTTSSLDMITEQADESIVAEEAVPEESYEVYYAPVDVDDWTEAYIEIWNDTHDEPINLEKVDPVATDEPYPSLAMADIDYAVNIELYAVIEYDAYCVLITYPMDDVPARSTVDYETLFKDAVITAVMAQHDEVTMGEKRAMETENDKYVTQLIAGEVDEDDAYYFYGDTLVEFFYDEGYNEVYCRISY